jgi:hypothetical protein
LNFNKKVFLLVIISSLLRMLVAANLELGNDEVYYQTYAQHLQWNYFDHPPMVALLIRLSTFNLFFFHEFFIRLGSVGCAALGTWLIFKIGCVIKNELTGWIAAVLYTTSLYSSVIAGIFILPDSPQVVCWLLSIYGMTEILNSETGSRRQNGLFILLGIVTGCCIMSKIHGIFLWLGFGGYLIFHRRDLLKSPMLWISGLITILIISPIFFWNLKNHFITYTYHQGRIGFFGNRPDLDRLLQQVLGSVFYSNPVNFILYLLALITLSKNKIKKLPGLYPLFLWLSLPLIIVLLVTSLFNETLPHWSGPAYLSMMLLTACWLEEQKQVVRNRWLRTAGWVFAVVLTVGTLGIRFLPWPMGSHRMNDLGRGDITLDMSGWKSFAIGFDSMYRSDLQTGRMKPGSTIVSDYWFPAGHLDHYCAIPFGHNLIAFGPLNNIHHFAWLNKNRPRIKKNSDAYFIYPTNEFGPPGQKVKSCFQKVEDSVLLPQVRSGHIVRYFVVYRMHQFLGDSADYLIPGIESAGR